MGRSHPVRIHRLIRVYGQRHQMISLVPTVMAT